MKKEEFVIGNFYETAAGGIVKAVGPPQGINFPIEYRMPDPVTGRVLALRGTGTLPRARPATDAQIQEAWKACLAAHQAAGDSPEKIAETREFFGIED